MVHAKNGSRILAAALLLLAELVRAEIFHFDSELVPDSRTLVAKYMFYVYSHADAPDRSKGHPYVQFSDFVLESVGDPEEEEGASKAATASVDSSLQVSLIPWEDFWNLVDPNRFCSTYDDVSLKMADNANQLLLKGIPPGNFSKAGVIVHTVGPSDSVAKPKDTRTSDRKALKRTGVYLLVISNCGVSKEVTISGQVIVRNSFGFLPGNEYGKMLVYAGIATAYFATAALWVALSLRYWQELIYIHYCISVVIVLGLFEAILWWAYLVMWNSSGISYQIFLSSAILLSGTKTVVTFILVLVTALGKGVTKPTLDGATLMKIWALGILYVVLDFTRMYVIELRQRYSLSVKFVGMCIVPTVTLSAIITAWIFMAISGLIRELREQAQEIKLRLYQRFNCVMVFTLVAAIVTLGLQLYDQPGMPSKMWSYHWMCTDLVSGIVFLLFLLSMMAIWAPHEGSKRMAYSQQIGNTDDMDHDIPTAFGNDPDEEEKGDVAATLFGVDATLGGKQVVGTVEMAEHEPLHEEKNNEPEAQTIGAKEMTDEV